MFDIDEVLARFRAAKKIRFDKEVAEIIGLSATDMSNRKKRGTLLEVLVDYARQDGMDVDWLVGGGADNNIGIHSDPAINSVLAEIIDLEGIDQPMRLSKNEALAVVMLRELDDTRRQQYYSAITDTFLASRRR